MPPRISRRPTIGRSRFILPQLILVTSPLPWRRQYLHPNWLRLKAAILERDGHQCRRCRTKWRCLHVHHRRYKKGGYIWDVPHTWLITLCDRCHEREHRQKVAKRKTKAPSKGGRKVTSSRTSG